MKQDLQQMEAVLLDIGKTSIYQTSPLTMDVTDPVPSRPTTEGTICPISFVKETLVSQ